MTTVRAQCPICRGSEFRTVYPCTIDAPDDCPEAYFGAHRSRVGHFDVKDCVVCGLRLEDPRDDHTTLAAAYAHLDAFDERHLGPAHARMAKRQLSLLRRFVPPPATLIDVGAGGGSFARAAHDAGYRVSALEPSLDAMARAALTVPRVTWIRGTLERGAVEPGTFDVVTLFDVLEHVEGPRAALETLREWLRASGLLMIQVPNARSVTARLLGRHWPLLLREHLTYFDPRTIAAVLTQAGFEVLAIESVLRSFPVGHFIRRLAKGRAKRERVKPSSVANIVLSAPAGELIAVARRRS